MKKIDDWMETHLPWGINNGIKFMISLPFMVLYVIWMLILNLTNPFKRDFWDGSSQEEWFWEWNWNWED